MPIIFNFPIDNGHFAIYNMAKMAIKNKQGQLLKRYIRLNRMRQGEFARLLGVSSSHLCKVIGGSRRLGAQKSFEAAQIVGIPMESFFQ